MKRMMIVIATLVFIATASAVFAQDSAAGSDTGAGLAKAVNRGELATLYPVHVDITRVYIHSQGYRIVYRKGGSSFAEAYVPMGWFTPGGKAALIRGRGSEYPYMVAYFKPDGEFSHLKLFVLQNVKDPSWGVIEGDPGDRFKVDTLKLEF
ncbi:MAG: hypothetical protein JXM71_07225 [Spirochaetales bacterium]|nr:hypothetical protein [Spirochaetales bacterium]